MGRSGRFVVFVLALVAAFAVAAPAASAAPKLRAGVATADITPPTGFPLGGWTRADRIAAGVHTRLGADVVVLERGGRKVALVSVDLFAATGGLVKEAAARAGHGFSQRNVLVSASHTHAGPGGYANFPTLNTVAPSPATATDPLSFAALLQPAEADPRLYTFLVKRLALALRRADRDVGPAAAAWGVTKLKGVTQNRSLEAHLADHGIEEEFGEGEVAQDPDGYEHTIDPTVSMLRVDRVRGDRRIPIGGWSMFANHGTVNPSEFTVYNEDHHGTARRVLERRIRKAGDVPRGRDIVAVYGNGNEGDQSAGLKRQGPSRAEAVGRSEGAAMFRAWRRAGRRLDPSAPLDLRWTRVCFCGQETADGPVSEDPLPGIPFLTGSEEGRGPLFDITGEPLEGRRSPVDDPFGSQGHKIGAPFTSREDYPTAVPLFVVRVGDRMIASLPGEPTVEVGRRTRRAVMSASRGTGVKGVVVSGLTNEFIQYITTPEEYDRQHYEGGSTIYGPAESAAMIEPLAELAGQLRRGRPARPADPFDPTNGVEADAAAYPRGARRGRTLTQPPRVRRGQQAVFVWRGGRRGFDRPLDRRFITIKKRTRNGWRAVTNDLGVQIVWTVDDDRRYEMHWQTSPRTHGKHRVVVSANRYRLRSKPFRVTRRGPATGGDPDHPAARFAPITRRPR